MPVFRPYDSSRTSSSDSVRLAVRKQGLEPRLYFPLQAAILLAVWVICSVHSRRRPRLRRMVKITSRERVRALAKRRALLTALYGLGVPAPPTSTASQAAASWAGAAVRGTAPRAALASLEVLVAQLSSRLDRLTVENDRLKLTGRRLAELTMHDSTIASLRQELTSLRVSHRRLKAEGDAAAHDAEARAEAARRDAAASAERVRELSQQLEESRSIAADMLTSKQEMQTRLHAATSCAASLQREVNELHAAAERRVAGSRAAEAAVERAESDAATARAAARAAEEVADRNIAELTMLRDVVRQQNSELADLKTTLRAQQQNVARGPTCSAASSSASGMEAGNPMPPREEPAQRTTLPTAPPTAAAPAARMPVSTIQRLHSELDSTSEIVDCRARMIRPQGQVSQDVVWLRVTTKWLVRSHLAAAQDWCKCCSPAA